VLGRAVQQPCDCYGFPSSVQLSMPIGPRDSNPIGPREALVITCYVVLAATETAPHDMLLSTRLAPLTQRAKGYTWLCNTERVSSDEPQLRAHSALCCCQEVICKVSLHNCTAQTWLHRKRYCTLVSILDTISGQFSQFSGIWQGSRRFNRTASDSRIGNRQYRHVILILRLLTSAQSCSRRIQTTNTSGT
jgi:hypothetical protein